MDKFKNLPTKNTYKLAKPTTSSVDAKKPNPTKQNKPLAPTHPGTSNRTNKHAPATGTHVKNRVTYKPSGSYNRHSRKKPHRSVKITKQQQPGPATKKHVVHRNLKSKLRAFFAWSRTLPHQAALKNSPAYRTFAGYYRRGTSKHHTSGIKKSVIRTLLQAVKKKAGKKIRRCVRLKTGPFVLTEPQARCWLRNNQQLNVLYHPTGDSALLKSFTSMLKRYSAHAGKKDTAAWKTKQASRIASWYVSHYHPYRQRAWLDKTLFKRAQQLKYSLGDSQRLVTALLKRIKKHALTQVAFARTSNVPEFLARVAGVRRELAHWCARPRAKNKNQKLRQILQRLLRPQSRKEAGTMEDRVAKLLWLFLTPQIRFKTAVPLSRLRPAALNKKKNLWRKLAPVLGKGTREQVYFDVRQKILDICGKKNLLRVDVFNGAAVYELEKLKLRLRQSRAGHSGRPVMRKKVWRRRPWRRQLGRRGKRLLRHKFCRRLRRLRRPVIIKARRAATTKPTLPPVKRIREKARLQPTPTALKTQSTTTAWQKQRTYQLVPTAIKTMATNYSRFYSTKSRAWHRSTIRKTNYAPF